MKGGGHMNEVGGKKNSTCWTWDKIEINGQSCTYKCQILEVLADFTS